MPISCTLLTLTTPSSTTECLQSISLMSLPPPLCRPRLVSPSCLTLSPTPPPSHSWHPTTPPSHHKPKLTSSPPSQISMRRSVRLLTALSPPSIAEKSPMRSRLRSATKLTTSFKRSSRSTPRRSTRSSSSWAALMVTSPTMGVSQHSSLSERGSSYPPRSSNSEMMGESYACQGRSIMRTRTPLTFSSVPTTHHKTSPSPFPSGSTLCSTALPPPTIPSVAPLPTSTTGTPPPKWSVTVDKTTDCAISTTSLPSSKPRCISLKMISQRADIASKPLTSRPAFQIWREEPGRKITPHANAPLGEGLVEDQEVQTRTGGDDTVLYLCLRVIRTNWA
jgi:hypothetical protein